MFTAPLPMDCKHTPNLTDTTSISYKKKEENDTSLSTPLTRVSLVNKFKALLDEAPSKPNTGETPDPLISASNNAEMSDTISYNEAQRTCHQRRCKAGQVGKDGKIQYTLHAGETPDPLSCSSNNDEMLENQHQSSIQECSITTDFWCKTCGVLNEEVPLSAKFCKECNSTKLYEATENQVVAEYGYGDDAMEYVHFLNLEGNESLGTRDPDSDSYNPYWKKGDGCEYVKSKACVPVPRTIKVVCNTFKSKLPNTDDQNMIAEIESQICNLGNALLSGEKMLENWAKKVYRLTRQTSTNQISLSGRHKQVAVNMYKKIIRTHGHYLDAVYPETPEHLTPKKLGLFTWKYQLATKKKVDGKWVPLEAVDIGSVIQVLESFVDCSWSYPTAEFVKDEIIMFGDENIPQISGGKMRNQDKQSYNMEYMLEQTTHMDGSKLDRGVDGIFDGDVVNNTPAYEVLVKARLKKIQSHEWDLD